MNLPPAVLFGIVLLIGFLTSSTVYFYNKSHVSSSGKSLTGATFQADLPTIKPSESAQKVDELTKPAEPKGRLSYPANVYLVAAKESLSSIGTKFGISWQLIKLANGVVNENAIQAAYPLAIPKLDQSSDLYRLTFQLNDDLASQMNHNLQNQTDDPAFSPVEVAKKSAVPYFGITTTDEFTLLEQNDSNATALVQAKNGDSSNVVGLYQPKTKGKHGLWAVLYIEHQK